MSESISSLSTFCLLKPVSIRLRLTSVRRNKQAPTMSTNDSATCEVTSIFTIGKNTCHLAGCAVVGAHSRRLLVSAHTCQPEPNRHRLQQTECAEARNRLRHSRLQGRLSAPSDAVTADRR